jgi:hypothetical protein
VTVPPDDRTVRATRQPVVRQSRQHRPSRAACRVSEASPGLRAGQEMHSCGGRLTNHALVLVEMARIPARLRPPVASGLSWSKERPQGRRKCSSTAPGGSRADGPVRARGRFEWVGTTRCGFGPLASSAGWFSVRHGSAWGQRRGESTPAGIIRQGVGGSAWSATASARLTIHAGGVAETAWTGRDPTSRDGTPHRPTGNPARTSRFGGS